MLKDVRIFTSRLDEEYGRQADRKKWQLEEKIERVPLYLHPAAASAVSLQMDTLRQCDTRANFKNKFAEIQFASFLDFIRMKQEPGKHAGIGSRGDRRRLLWEGGSGYS